MLQVVNDSDLHACSMLYIWAWFHPFLIHIYTSSLPLQLCQSKFSILHCSSLYVYPPSSRLFEVQITGVHHWARRIPWKNSATRYSGNAGTVVLHIYMQCHVEVKIPKYLTFALSCSLQRATH